MFLLLFKKIFLPQGTYFKEINDLKLKFQKIEHENNILKQEVFLKF